MAVFKTHIVREIETGIQPSTTTFLNYWQWKIDIFHPQNVVAILLMWRQFYWLHIM